MQILDALRYGNIYPSEQFLGGDKEYFKALHKLSAEQERLMPNFSPENRDAVEELLDMQIDVTSIAQRKAFTEGFRLGAQIIMASFSDDR